MPGVRSRGRRNKNCGAARMPSVWALPAVRDPSLASDLAGGACGRGNSYFAARFHRGVVAY